MRANPYTPGAGDRPRRLVGRERQLALADAVRERVQEGLPANPLFFMGLRGVGKTVLLKEIAERFQRQSWYALYLTLRRNATVADVLVEGARRMQHQLPETSRLRRALRAIAERGVSVQAAGAGVAIGPCPTPSPSEQLYELLMDLVTAARAEGTGVILLVDELQEAKVGSLADLIDVVQYLREHQPFALIGAGLPRLQDVLTDAASFAYRFDYHWTDKLDEADARRAVVDPAAELGVHWDDDALAQLVQHSKGYPYYLQRYAAESWLAAAVDLEDAAPGTGRIERRHVMTALQVVQRVLDTEFESRLRKLSQQKQRYVYAILEVMDERGEAETAAVARQLGKEITQLSAVRDRLIQEGVIYAPRRGAITFALPGFADFLRMRAQAELDAPGRELVVEWRPPRLGL